MEMQSNKRDSSGNTAGVLRDEKRQRIGLSEEKVQTDEHSEARDVVLPKGGDIGRPTGTKEKGGPTSEQKKASADASVGKNFKPFPERLMDILSNDEFKDALWWNAEGDTFCIDPGEFTDKVMKIHFQGTKFESFTRKLNRWGFKRILDDEDKYPPGLFAYRHELFLRDKQELLKSMAIGKKKDCELSVGGPPRMALREEHNPVIMASPTDSRAFLPQQTSLAYNFLPGPLGGQPTARLSQLPSLPYSGGTSAQDVLALQTLQSLQRQRQQNQAITEQLRLRMHLDRLSGRLDPPTLALNSPADAVEGSRIHVLSSQQATSVPARPAVGTVLTSPLQQQRQRLGALSQRQRQQLDALSLNQPTQSLNVMSLNQPSQHLGVLSLNQPSQQLSLMTLSPPSQQLNALLLNQPRQQLGTISLNQPRQMSDALLLTQPRQQLEQLPLNQPAQHLEELSLSQQRQQLEQLSISQQRQQLEQLSISQQRQQLEQLSQQRQQLEQLSQQRQQLEQLSLSQQRQQLEQLSLGQQRQMEQMQQLDQLSLSQQRQQLDQLSLSQQRQNLDKNIIQLYLLEQQRRRTQG